MYEIISNLLFIRKFNLKVSARLDEYCDFLNKLTELSGQPKYYKMNITDEEADFVDFELFQYSFGRHSATIVGKIQELPQDSMIEVSGKAFLGWSNYYSLVFGIITLLTGSFAFVSLITLPELINVGNFALCSGFSFLSTCIIWMGLKKDRDQILFTLKKFPITN
jgi:hypothetical protein